MEATLNPGSQPTTTKDREREMVRVDVSVCGNRDRVFPHRLRDRAGGA